MNTKCNLFTITGRARFYLRRFTFSDTIKGRCRRTPGLAQDHHDASTCIGDFRAPINAAGYLMVTDSVPHDDERWPIRCGCGYEFTEADEFQVRPTWLLQNDAGEVYPQENLPAGAMYFKEAKFCARGQSANKSHLFVVLPDGVHWDVDGPSVNGLHWKRRGEAPDVTVEPSIQTPDFHGWLKNGVLIPC